MTLDPLTRINDLRRKVLAGEQLTTEEAKEALQALRSQRESTARPQKAAVIPMNLNDLFSKEEKK